MAAHADSFSLYQVKDIISESEDSDSNIVENSEDEFEERPIPYNKQVDISIMRRKKKVQVISSDDEDEEAVKENSEPLPAVMSVLSSSKDHLESSDCENPTNPNFVNIKKKPNSNTQNFLHQDLQDSAPKHHSTNVDSQTQSKVTKGFCPSSAALSSNITGKGLVSGDSCVKESVVSKTKTSFGTQQSSEDCVSPSLIHDASNAIQILPKVPHNSVTSTGTKSGVKNNAATHSSIFPTKTTSVINSDEIVISDTDDCSASSTKEHELQEKMSTLMKERDKMKTVLRTSNLAALPDNGARLQMQIELYEKEIRQMRRDLQSIILNNASLPKAWSGSASSQLNKPFPQASFPQQPRVVPPGTKALEALRVERSLTNDALEQLHGSIKSCPSEETLADDPNGLKTGIQLMPHQKRALAWLTWRETQNPRGGVLADDMGLGKTLTMISLVMKSKQEKPDVEDSSDDSDVEPNKENWLSRKNKFVKGGTLVVCPASLLNQWEEEVHAKCRRGLLEVEVYHGQNRQRPRQLAKKDIVITTYNIVRTEAGILPKERGNTNTSHKIATKKGNLFQVKWERIILDEAHVVRNHKSQTSIAVSLLSARNRWALTGTPIHNKELDFYALLKFLRCSPFDDYLVWRRWVDNKNASGLQRLNTVVNSIMLRRTKAQLQEKGSIKNLPEKHNQLIHVRLDDDEFEVYQKVLVFSKTLFAQFLHQRSEREQTMESRYGPVYSSSHSKQNREIAAWQQKLASMPDIKSFEILVLLLRLRQLCCHPSLITAMLEKDVCEVDGIEDDDGTDIDLLAQFGNLGLENNPGSSSNSEVKTNILSLENPVFQRDRVSSKMRVMMEKLQEKIVDSGDKAIIVSQWTTMLDIVGNHLEMHGLSCARLTGAVPVKERMAIVSDFNQASRGAKVLLLSLTAGGVGLNLVGANHLFLFDLHWNPQLESQACDRIYRFGQKKDVHIYKFVCEDTIEQRIKMLQDSKLSVAENVLSGAHKIGSNKLSLNDLKMLFSM
ncbi:transcription termination factor 2 [Bacillus rossius redtenbacheri]|uniref:transcription termination factor 2 n=1 Tax=Bacillus rossius redtenbacheri TaxID=93214 RepID=UPI002FDEF34E